MKLSNQNIHNLRGCKNFWGQCQMPLGGGANNFWGCAPPRKSVPESITWFTWKDGEGYGLVRSMWASPFADKVGLADM